jgi:uncharacterized RDD family membrane protein YckC
MDAPTPSPCSSATVPRLQPAADAVMNLANPLQRTGAWLLDWVIATIVFTPFNPLLYDSSPSPGLFYALGVPGLLFIFVCFALFDGGEKGATPGKRIVGIRVTDADGGGAIGFKRGLVRRLGYGLGGLVLYIGWLWMLGDGRRQAWHDKLANTVVVRTRG